MKKDFQQILIFFIIGIAIAFLGGFAGLVIGMTIGGNFDPPFYFGGLPGYEGTGLLGSIIGLSLAVLIWIDFRLDTAIRKHARMILFISTIITLLIQDFIARRNGNGLFLITFLPIASEALLLSLYRPNEF